MCRAPWRRAPTSPAGNGTSADGSDDIVGTVPTVSSLGPQESRPPRANHRHTAAAADDLGRVAMRTHHTSGSGVRVAYQVFGRGDIDIVLVPGMGSHIELHWCEPLFARFMRSLAGMGRVITFDKRGTGASDRVAGIPTLEDRMRDLVAVLDAAGSERAVVLGISEGAALAALLAASHPARVRGLVLCSSFPTGSQTGDYLGAVRPERLETALDVWNHWGSGRSYDIYAPSLVGRGLSRHFLGVFERAAASPQMMRSLVDALFAIDIRHVLPAVRVPTLMFHRVDEIAPIESARQMAALIPDCGLIELDGDDHVPYSEPGASVILERTAQFVSEVRANRMDRAVGTVMFTDIVESTRLAAALGDRSWLELLDGHDRVVRSCVAEHGGRELKNLGDGFLIHFDGPVRAIRCAASITDAVRPLGVEVRAGIHTGELELTDREVRGLAVHVGARVSATAGPSEIRVSAAVKDLAVGSGIEFVPQAPTTLKGLDGRWLLYSVDASTASPPTPAPTVEARTDRLGALDRGQVWFAKTFPALARLLLRLERLWVPRS